VNDELSIISLILEAGLVVKAVMLILLLASLVSWGMIVQRSIFFMQAQRSLDSFEDEFWSGGDVSAIYKQGSQTISSDGEIAGMESIFRAGFKEFSRMQQQSNADSGAVMDGAQRSMRVALYREQDKLEKSLSFLATVGSTSPYIGLFGTVWGMCSKRR
jgi:biopolymer transport protein TolQ